ncbi:MAG TPA: beta-ketoacyl-[acyl-carrier-protein] synthase family protein [Polyangia bacterium]
MSPAPRAVITGLGAVSGLGLGVAAFWDGLCAGRSAIGPGPGGAAGAAGHLAAAVPGGDPGPRRATWLVQAAAAEALAMAGLDPPFGPRLAPAVAVAVGSTLGGLRTFLPRLRGTSRATPPTFTPAGPAVELAAGLGAEGPLLAPSIACASGTAAVGAALDLVRGGRARVVVCGGVDTLSDFVVAGFQALQALDGEPARPFDAARHGLSLGEGAAVLVVEDEDHARGRGATVLACLTGYGLSDDANHMTGPDPRGRGASRGMRAALRDAGRTPAEVDFISLHGTGTVYNDLMEHHAVHDLCGARAGAVPVNSIKGAIGHTLGAAGAFEAVLCARVAQTGLIPPTTGLAAPDPQIVLDLVRGAPRAAPVRVAVSTTSGFGGLNAAIVVERAG